MKAGAVTAVMAVTEVMSRPSDLGQLFKTFIKIGVFTFGGGYAMISVIENLCVEQKQWITYEDMMNITVIAEATPGPIAINCATFTGYRQAGFKGALAATAGLVTPSFVIIFAISMFLDHFLEITWIAHAFWGIKIAVGILIVDAAAVMIKKMKKKPLPLGIMTVSFVVILAADLLSRRISSIVLMTAAAIFSLGLYLIKEQRKAGKI